MEENYYEKVDYCLELKKDYDREIKNLKAKVERMKKNVKDFIRQAEEAVCFHIPTEMDKKYILTESVQLKPEADWEYRQKEMPKIVLRIKKVLRRIFGEQYFTLPEEEAQMYSALRELSRSQLIRELLSNESYIEAKCNGELCRFQFYSVNELEKFKESLQTVEEFEVRIKKLKEF